MNIKDFEEGEEIREYQYVYFVENHIKSTHIFIELSRNQIVADNLECVKTDIKEINSKDIYIYSIYRFRFYSSRIKEIDSEIKKNLYILKGNMPNNWDIQFNHIEAKNYDIAIELMDEKGDKFEKIINIKDFENDIFLFDFKFDKISDLSKNKYPPKSYSFSLEEEFLIYIDFLRNGNMKLKQKSRQNYGLILSVQQILEESEKKLNFSFYLIILLECYATPLVQRLLFLFNPSKLDSLGVISQGKLKQITNVLNVIEKNPDKIFVHSEENIKRQLGIRLFAVIIYFNLNFNKNRIPGLFRDEMNKIFIYRALLEYCELFDCLKLDSEQIQLLIDFAEDFNELNIALRYNKNIQELLDIILLNFVKIFQLYLIQNEEYKKKINNGENIKKPIINIMELVLPDRNDFIQNIYDLYCSIITIQRSQTKDNFIYFSPSFFEIYIDYFNAKSIDNLIKIKEMIKFSKDNSIDIKLDIDINYIIHENGILFSSNGKLKNSDLLDFITLKDKYYISSSYQKMRSLDILNGLDISFFDDKFYEKWKKINWNDIFREQKVPFYEKVLTFIKDLNDFNILYKLFDLKDIKDNFVIELLQKKIVELYKNYNPENHLNFNEDLIILIYYSDKKNVKIESFLTNTIQKDFNTKSVNKIYIYLLSVYGNEISQKSKKIIAKFFTETPDNMNPDTLLYLIAECPNCVKNIFENLEIYNIKKEDFLQFEDTNNYILFKGLLGNNYLEKNEILDTNYIKNSREITNKLIKDIEQGELSFREIITFYENKSEDKSKNKLLERMTTISFNSKEKGNKLKKMIDNYYSTISLALSDLKVILDDLLEFYYHEESKNIAIIAAIINDLKNGKLNCLEKNFTEKYVLYRANYEKKAKERALKRKSQIFSIILKRNKKKYKYKDDACVEETLEDFDKLKKIFTTGAKSLDRNVLQDCLKAIQGKNEEEIENEILILIELFKIKYYHIDEIRKSMILLSKKENVYNISIVISFLLERQQIKGSLSEKLKEIIKNLEKSDEENVILDAINDLKLYSIDIDTLYDENLKEDNYLNTLLKLKRHPEALALFDEIKFNDCHSLEEFVSKIDYNLLNNILE